MMNIENKYSLDADIDSLIVSFYGDIDKMQFAEALVANQLKKQRKVATLRCQGTLANLCHVIELHKKANNNINNSKSICRICRSKSAQWSVRSATTEIFLDNLVQPGIIETFIVAIDKFLENKEVITPSDFHYDNVAFGAYAAYDLIVSNRLISNKIESYLFSAFKASCVNVAKTYYGFKLLTSKLPKLKEVFLNDVFYSAHRGIADYAHKIAIDVFEISLNPIADKKFPGLTIHKLDSDLRPTALVESWERYKNSIPDIKVKDAYRHFDDRFNQRSLFSYSKGLDFSHGMNSKISNILDSKKVAPRILFIMSSGDEQYAQYVSRFPYDSKSSDFNLSWHNQLRAFSKVIERLPSNSICIIRPHPRLMDSRRFSGSTDLPLNEIEKLKDSNLRLKVFIDFGEDQGSVYSLIPRVDMVVTSNSTVGLESMLLGTPSIRLEDAPLSITYPISISYKLDDLSKLIKDGKFKVRLSSTFMKKRILAFKWLSFNTRDKYIWPIEDPSDINDNSIFSYEPTKTEIKNTHIFKAKFRFRYHFFDLYSLFFSKRAKGYVNSIWDSNFNRLDPAFFSKFNFYQNETSLESNNISKRFLEKDSLPAAIKNNQAEIRDFEVWLLSLGYPVEILDEH